MRHGGLDGIAIGHVQFNDVCITTLTFNLGTQFLEFFQPATGQHHGGTRSRQGACKLGTQAAGRTCNEGDTPGKVNAVSHLENLHESESIIPL